MSEPQAQEPSTTDGTDNDPAESETVGSSSTEVSPAATRIDATDPPSPESEEGLPSEPNRPPSPELPDDDDSIELPPIQDTLESLDDEIERTYRLSSKVPDLKLAKLSYGRLACKLKEVIQNPGRLGANWNQVRRYASLVDIVRGSAEQIDWLPVNGSPSRKDFSKKRRERVLRAQTFKAASRVVGTEEAMKLYHEPRNEKWAQYAVNSPWAACNFNEELDKIIEQSRGRLLQPGRANQLLRKLRVGERQRRTNEYPLDAEVLCLNNNGTARDGSDLYLQAFQEMEERRDNRRRLRALMRRAMTVAVEPESFRDYPDVSPEDNPTVAAEVMNSLRLGNLKAPVWDRDGNLVGYISSRWKWSGIDFIPSARMSAQDGFWHLDSPLRTVVTVPPPPVQTSVGVEETSEASPAEMVLYPHTDFGVSITESDNEAAQTRGLESNGVVYLVFAMTLILCFWGRT
ncbi:hypothetical protein V8F33_012896 [Rhypophila sp. PSN 637]